jgi:hypothetical protein
MQYEPVLSVCGGGGGDAHCPAGPGVCLARPKHPSPLPSAAKRVADDDAPIGSLAVWMSRTCNGW